MGEHVTLFGRKGKSCITRVSILLAACQIMTPAEKAQLDEQVQAIAKILYADADKGQTIGSSQQVPLTRICKK